MKNPLTKKELLKNILSDNLKNTTTLPYTIKECQNHLLEKHNISIATSHLREVLSQMGIQGRLARHSKHTREAVEQYFKELVPNNEGFKTYTINHIRTYIKNKTNIHPDPKTVNNILNALNIENIKLIKRKKECYSLDTLNAVKNYFNTLAPDENGIKPYVMKNVLKHVIKIANTESSYSTIENIISTLNLKNIKRIPKSPNIPNQWLPHLNRTTDAVRTYINQLPENKIGFKTYTIPQIRTYLKETLNIKSTPDTIRKIISSLDDIKCGTITSQWPEYLNKVENAMRIYFNQLPENENGIKAYSLQHVHTYLKETIDPKITKETIRKVISSLGIDNIKPVPTNSRRYSQEIRNYIVTYFETLPKNEHGIKIYTVLHITHLIKKDLNISMSNYTVQKIIEDIGLKNIKNKKSDRAKNLKPIVQQYFKQLAPNQDGIKLYKTEDVSNYIKEKTNTTPSKVLIVKAIKSLKMTKTTLIQRERSTNKSSQHHLHNLTEAMQTYFNQLPENENGFKVYTEHRVSSYLKEKIGINGHPRTIKKIINNLKLGTLKNLQSAKEEREQAIQKYFNKIKPDKNGIKIYVLAHITDYIKNVTNTSPATITIKKIIDSLELGGIQQAKQEEIISHYKNTATPSTVHYILKKQLTKKDIVKKIIGEDFKNTTTLPYTVKEFQLYIFQTKGMQISPRHIRYILEKLNIGYKKAENLSDAKKIIEDYFTELTPNGDGIKLYKIKNITNYINAKFFVKRSTTTVSRIIKSLHIKNIKKEKNAFPIEVEESIKNYFDALQPNKSGFKEYSLNHIRKHILQQTDINVLCTIIKKVIDKLNMESIKQIHRNNQNLEQAKLDIKKYFSQLEPDKSGIKLYNIQNIIQHLQLIRKEAPNYSTITNIIEKLDLKNIKLIKSSSYSTSVKQAIEQYFSELKPDKSGIKAYTIHHIRAHIINTVNIHSAYLTIRKIIKGLNLKNTQCIEKKDIYSSIVTSYFNKIAPDADGIKRYTLTQIDSYIQNYTQLNPSPKTITKVINKLNLKNIQPT